MWSVLQSERLNMDKVTKRSSFPRKKGQIWALFLASFTALFGPTANLFANPMDVGYKIESSKIDDPDHYLSSRPQGAEIKRLYDQYAVLRKKPLNHLPVDFEPILDRIEDYILQFSAQTDEESLFYVGPMGEKNGEGFDFKRENLPSKLAKLSFCFGIDPLIFTGLVRQESHFYRYAKSTTGASGFTQLTNAAITEVSEQLGLLGSDFHGDGAPETFHSYIQCYLGTEKSWLNPWESGAMATGAQAYLKSFTGSGRKLTRIKEIKQWLNEDPDRNLIYGAIMFKVQLGRTGNYEVALKEYNTSHPGVYYGNISRAYNRMAAPMKIALPPSSKDETLLRTADESNWVYQFKNSTCLVPAKHGSGLDEHTLFLLNDFNTKEESEALAEAMLKEKGYCQSKTTYL